MKTKLLNVVLVFLTIQSFSQIVNEGILKIKDGTTVYFADTYTNKVGATHNNEGNLHLNADLINNGTMVLSANADTANGITYFDSSTATIQNISGTNAVVFENLEVNMSNATVKGVSVADNTELVVEKGVTLTSGDLRLVNEAQLIQKHTGTNANSGTKNLLRDQQGTVDVYNYNYWSSPVSGATANQYQVGEVLFDGSDAGTNPFTPQQVTFSSASPWNGTPATLTAGTVTTPTNLESYWIWKFENQTIDDLNGWTLLRNNTAINAGIGFTLKGNGAATANQNYTFKGKPNDGTYTYVLGVGNSTMLGNPYPSALDANKFINDNAAVLSDVNTPSATTGAIYFWEHWGGNSHYQSDYQGGYATYTLAGGTPPTSHPLVNGGGTSSGINGQRYIPVAQGFFVESNTGGTVTIDNSQRIFKVEAADSHFFRNANNPSQTDEVDTTPRIRLAYNNPQGYYRQIMTAFIDQTHDRHDIGYDARMADVNNDDMFWETNNVPFVIDARPFSIEKQIPIGLHVSTEGTHKIYLFEAENFTNPIYILDTETGYTTDIRQGDFEVDLVAGEYLDRFKLVFQPQSPLDINDVLNENLNVFYTNTSQEIVIKNPNAIKILDVSIFDAIGKLIKKVNQNEFTNISEIKLPFHVASGTYIIRVNSDKGKGGFKIIAY